MKKKKINYYAYGILVGFLIISIIFWYYSDNISDWSETANPLLVTLVNFSTNPFYIGSIILFIELFFKGYKLKRNTLNYARIIIASIILSLAIDIVTILHTVSFSYVLPTGFGLGLYFDTILGGILQTWLGPLKETGTFILYVVIPFIMAMTALFIASPSKFLGLVKREFGG